VTDARRPPALTILHRVEDGALVVALVAMVALAGGQIVLRLFFGTGVLWIDPVLRSLVLWIGMLGALVASRSGQHIAIDVVTRALPERWRRRVLAGASAFTTAVCFGFAWHGGRYVALELEFASNAFADVPQWLVVTILPVAFSLIGLRYAIFCIAFAAGHDPFAGARS
jgi:TRAP-type C4-dicarboxylate transport system permease small subunit